MQTAIAWDDAPQLKDTELFYFECIDHSGAFFLILREASFSVFMKNG